MRVLATDASARQLAAVVPHPRIDYRVAPVETSGLADGSATSLPWPRLCRAGSLPRKELYEAWECARRVRRRFRGGRVIDLACGHGLLAQLMLLLAEPLAPVET